MKLDFIKQKDPRKEELVNGLNAYSEIGKPQKPLNLKQCEYLKCKVMIKKIGGKKYCNTHSVDRKYELLRKL